MRRKTLRSAALLALSGCLLQFGGCLGGGWWGRLIWDAALYAGWEYLTDNDAMFDLWEDSAVTAMQE